MLYTISLHLESKHKSEDCKNGGAVWNRDVNSATNIYKIAENAMVLNDPNIFVEK